MKALRVLVACEFSGVVRDAFIKAGHHAVSCDLLPSLSTGPHFQGDVMDILWKGWDVLIGHPPCTYLCSSGMHWTTRGKRDPQLTEDALYFVGQLMNAPIERICIENPIGCISTRIRKPDQIIQPWMFGHDASKATCLWLKGLPPLTKTTIFPPKGYEEVVYSDTLPKCDCCDEPWCKKHLMHYSDCTCIGPTQNGIHYESRSGVDFGCPNNNMPKKLIWGNQTPSGQNKLGPSDNRWAERSVTYQGIADAMSSQWPESTTKNIETVNEQCDLFKS